jgi:hypothetical protein
VVLYRCISRPALSDGRVRCNAAGQLELKLKTPWRDGTTHVVMSPLEFMQRLAALVPRPLKRVIDVDIQNCSNCGAGELKIIATILERPVIEKILTHLGLVPQPPPKARAREAGHD